MPAIAHPHVFVTMHADLVYGPNGALVAVQHAWTFDDAYSSYAVMGLPQKTRGVFSREELAPLAQVNVQSLKDYNYFTYPKVNGRTVRNVFLDPVDYWMEWKDEALILHFTLPTKTPIAGKAIEVEIYDPEFLVDLAFNSDNPVSLLNAPASCTVQASRPHSLNITAAQRADPNFIISEAYVGMGADFASRIDVQCP